MELSEATDLLAGFDRPWFVAGGWAIDLYLRTVRRAHKDVDVAIFRDDQLAFQKYLSGHEMKKLVGRELVPWPTGDWLEPPDFQVFVKPGRDGDADLEVLMNESEGDTWRFRRNLEITRPKELIAMRSASGVPFLGPEVVLLFKSKYVYYLYPTNPNDDHYEERKTNDQADFQAVLKTLNDERRAWLRSALETCYPGHQWIEQL